MQYSTAQRNTCAVRVLHSYKDLRTKIRLNTGLNSCLYNQNRDQKQWIILHASDCSRRSVGCTSSTTPPTVLNMTVQHGRPRKIRVRMIKAVVARSQALILLLWLSTASTCHLGRHAVATAEAHATTTSTRAKAPPGALRNQWPHFPWHGISSSRRFAFVGNFGCRHRATRVSTDKNDGVMFLSNKRGGVHRINMVAEEQEPGEEAATTRNTAGRQRRKPRGNHLRKNEAGMPIERVYAPRQSQ